MDESFSGYARLGGYRARVDKDDVPTDLERTFRRAELGVGPDADLDVVYLVDLQAAGLNDTHGDGTVALSSARALAAWRDVPLTPADEPLRDSAHNELYQTATVQRATARAIQNMCFRRISDVVRGLAPAGDPPQPEAPQPEAPRGGSRRGGDGRSTPGDRPVPFRIRPRPVEGLAPPEVHRSHPPLALRPDADPDAPTAPFEGYGDAFGEDE